VQCVAVCCIVLQCIVGSSRWILDFSTAVRCFAVCCSAMQCVAEYCGICSLKSSWIWDLRTAVHCVAMFCSVLQCVAVCCSVLQCFAVCCSVFQCVAVCCSVWWLKHRVMTETSSMTRYADAAYAIPNVLSENDRCHKISGSCQIYKRVVSHIAMAADMLGWVIKESEYGSGHKISELCHTCGSGMLHAGMAADMLGWGIN